MGAVLAWIGGAVFVASLAYTAYFFVWILGESHPVNPGLLGRAIVVNALLFGLFAAHHSLFARESIKRLVVRVVPPRMERSTYVWAASLLLFVVLLCWQLVSGSMYRLEGPVRWALYAVQLAGVYLTVRAANSIDALELAGIRQVTQSPTPTVFRTDGPFGLVRHPIYLGWMLMVFATPTMTTNRFLFGAITSAYLLIAIPWEESSLLSAFGERYRVYQAAVRWRLIPGIW